MMDSLRSAQEHSISSQNRACFTIYHQDERGVRRAVSRTVHHILVCQLMRFGTREHRELATPWARRVMTTVPRRLPDVWMSSYGRIVGSPHVVLSELSINERNCASHNPEIPGWKSLCTVGAKHLSRESRRREWVFTYGQQFLPL
ncbi:hypothetical protein AVEN_226345-1 [Araneus ventricosus]|uniref:Uncharacterized protein n=1 Tax=Araneus ventricosus TaxID=182803 RepID=A0A4Y2IMW3_ARAVE|nr:hypothetical protein AVEN_226345-1 [Araneus ventricosus]